MKFHYLARAVIFDQGRVLLAHQKGAEHTFLPGGHIEPGEGAEAALVREIAEEFGKQAAVKRFVGAVECAFAEDGQLHHEINLIFEVQVESLDAIRSPASQEDHLEFFWAAPEELKSLNLLPEPMVDVLAKWETGWQGFWGSSL